MVRGTREAGSTSGTRPRTRWKTAYRRPGPWRRATPMPPRPTPSAPSPASAPRLQHLPLFVPQLLLSLFLRASSSSFFIESAPERRKATVAWSVASPPARDDNARGGAPTAERRTVRSLRCGPGSERLLDRIPGGDLVSPRRASCASCTTSSRWPWCRCSVPEGRASCKISIFGPALWWSAAAKAIATVCCVATEHAAVAVSSATRRCHRVRSWQPLSAQKNVTHNCVQPV